MTIYSGYHPDAFWEVEVLEHEVENITTEKDADKSNPVVAANFSKKKVDGTEETKE